MRLHVAIATHSGLPLYRANALLGQVNGVDSTFRAHQVSQDERGVTPAASEISDDVPLPDIGSDSLFSWVEQVNERVKERGSPPRMQPVRGPRLFRALWTLLLLAFCFNFVHCHSSTDRVSHVPSEPRSASPSASRDHPPNTIPHPRSESWKCCMYGQPRALPNEPDRRRDPMR